MNVRTNALRLLTLVMVCALSLLAILPTLVAASTSYPLQPTDSEIASALDYLRDAQQPDGSIGGFTNSAWVVMAIAAAGEDPGAWNDGGDSIVEYLAANAGDASMAIDYARMILAIIAAGEDPADFGGVDFLALLEAEYDGSQIGSTAALNDDAWGIMALIAAGESPTSDIVADSAAFIKADQNGNGGWGWAVGQASDADSTAAPVMALIAAGEPAASTVIQDALAYIKSTQMEDGGFESWGSTNADTDSWAVSAIVAAGEDPSGANWESTQGKTPVDDLLGFRNPDGSFNWKVGDPGMTIEKTTACAVVALLGESYPVETMEPQAGETVDVRIEALNETVWSGQVTVTDSTIIDDQGSPHYLPTPTALGALDAAAQEGGFAYTVKDFGWGLAVVGIDGAGDWEAGPWWLYRVDGVSIQIGADAFELNQTSPPDPPHGEVLFYCTTTFAELPLDIDVDKAEVAVGEQFVATVTYFDDDGQAWLPLDGATVHAGSDYLTGTEGTVAVTVGNDATLTVFAEKDGFIRSGSVTVTVGEGQPSSDGEVTLGADIIPAIAIEVDPDSIDFGELGPRDTSAEYAMTITNVGAWQVMVTAEVTDAADDLFVDGLHIDGTLWPSFETTISRDGEQVVDVSLTVPELYGGVGEMAGTLILWATEAQ